MRLDQCRIIVFGTVAILSGLLLKLLLGFVQNHKNSTTTILDYQTPYRADNALHNHFGRGYTFHHIFIVEKLRIASIIILVQQQIKLISMNTIFELVPFFLQSSRTKTMEKK